MTVSEAIKILETMPLDSELMYRPVLPLVGNVQNVFFITEETYSTFGYIEPCVILSEYGEECADDAANAEAPS